ncbi:MAG: RNA polymerase sigma factor [Ktedonobacteraceae bacterium]|nr:RNA polymerase sigma factor [Ktedonobacteraceae bacterium]
MDTGPTVEIETLIHDYSRLVFHTIYGLTGDWEESQDLTQDTFHQALKGLAAARSASGEHFHARAWLLRIALNTVRMQRRRRNIFRFIPFSRMPEGRQSAQGSEGLNEQAIPVQPPGYGAIEQDDPAELVAEQDAVRRTMAKLPENQRICLLLSVLGGLSTLEIARMLDLKEAAVRQRLARARKQFQQIYCYESGENLVNSPQPTYAHSEMRLAQTTQMDDEQDMSEQPHHLKLASHLLA